MRRARSWHFYVSGAIGGLVGFGLMELVRLAAAPTAAVDSLLFYAFQFAAFGLAVGAALGITESVVQRKFWRTLYGLIMGSVLGVVGGFFGGFAGQAIFNLLPTKEPPKAPGCDVAIVLDASNSMSGLSFFGYTLYGANDPNNLRIEAAKQLVSRLGASDRVTVVDFADDAGVLLPLTLLDGPAAKQKADRALSSTRVRGGTNLTAGLSVGLAQLERGISRQASEKRKQYLIFLTDGDGLFSSRVVQPAIQRGVEIYTIGLGSEVASSLLEHQIAGPTGGKYFHVANADELLPTFETIYQKAIRVGMAGHEEGAGSEYPVLFFLLRIASWAAMGLVIGFGQGIRENTKEDLRACSLGGLVGGVVGGALFDPLIGVVGNEVLGRMAAEVVVGACIGGSMRWAQGYLVKKESQPSTTLLSALPRRSGGLVMARPSAGLQANAPRKGLKGLVLKMRDTVEGSDGSAADSGPTGSPAAPPGPRRDSGPKPAAPQQTASPQPAPAPQSTPTQAASSVRLKPLRFYEQRYGQDRARAMAAAAEDGHRVEQIAAHFGVRPARVQQAIEQFGGAR